MKLHIERLDFELPDDFSGTLGDALTILAKYRKERELENKITLYRKDTCFNQESYDLMRDNRSKDDKCSVSYFIC